MSTENLRQALQGMPDTGASGFEGLVRLLLELVLNEPFVLARAGDQPSGDAHSSRRNVCVQAKRYADATLNSKSIEGDFDQSLRALPNTDIFVLAVTRNTAQLDDTLDAMRAKSAVDVVVWDFADGDSALATLCIEYWPQLQNFPALNAIDAELNPWALTIRSSSRQIERLARLRLELRECTQTLQEVRGAARSYLSRRFQLAPEAPPVPLHAILLGTAVDRPRYRAQATTWWPENKSRIVVLNAPEGYGKTWVAAQCAWKISEPEEPIVLWLDSLQWRDCASVEDVLHEAVSRLVIGDAQKVGRLVRKLKDRWSGRTLIVLDGVNERNALSAAQRIIEDLIFKHQGTCRLLFTTRPLQGARDFEACLWDHWLEIKVAPFDDPELTAALTKANIPEAELPERLRSIARIPRYFATCLRLRDQLARFENISVALVLWADLLDKMHGLEPGIRDTLGITTETDAEELLVKLATSLPSAVASGQAQDLLNRCFGGKYAEVRNYLKEIRIMEQSGVFEATLSKDHTVLGRALFLQQVLRTLSTVEIRSVADRLMEALEPLAEEDGSAEALFVTLQLTATRPGESAVDLRQQRAALLYAWVCSHNSNVSDERLEFWCGYDLNAYAQFITALFEESHSANTQQVVVNPLARLWQAGTLPAAALEPYLRRWLLLVWFDGCSGNVLPYRNHQLPIATTADQVRLASLAVSLLSLRPELKFLPDLALCLATDDLTWRQIQDQRHHFKSIHENVGVLMRWHYTERVLAELERIAHETQRDELLLEGFRELGRLLRMVEVPPILHVPPPEPLPYYFGTPPVELMRQGRRVFGCPRTEPYPNQRDFSYLAVRDDLPQLSVEDVRAIRGVVEEITAKPALHASRSQTADDSDLEIVWPWYARFFPLQLASLGGQLQLSALKREQTQQIEPMFWFLAGVLPSFDGDQLGEWERLANAKASEMKLANRGFESYLGLSISETALLLLPEENLHRWIVTSATDEPRRYSMFFGPLMELIPLVTPNETRLLAVEKCFELADCPLRSGEGPPTELEYWCYIAGLTTGPNERLYDCSRKRLIQTPASEERNFSLLRLWLRSAPPGRLEADLNCSDARGLFDRRALRAWALSGELAFDPKLLFGTYDELMSNLPQSFVGGVLALSGRYPDLNRWGQELFALAVKNLAKPPSELTSSVETRIRLAKNRLVKGVGIVLHTEDSYHWSSNANYWGVDSGSPNLDSLGRQSRQQLLDDELDRWRVDDSHIRKWEGYELHTFGASSALEAWSKSNPDEFLPRARTVLLAASENPADQYHLGGFLHAVICCLLPTATTEACGHFVAINQGHMRLSVRTDCDIPECYAILWDVNRCNLPAHDDLRRQVLTACQNEFEIMVFSIAALANHAVNRLMQVADEFLGHQLARERALAASILAWIGTEESICRLTHIAATDPSRWVRTHAEWATEVSLQEKSARAFFRRLLHEPDPYVVSAKLQVLKPALTPLARWWHEEILDEERRTGLTLAARNTAILTAFWHHWTSTHKSHVAVWGRQLDEFCRGEKLHRLLTSRTAPWWRPERDPAAVCI